MIKNYGKFILGVNRGIYVGYKYGICMYVCWFCEYNIKTSVTYAEQVSYFVGHLSDWTLYKSLKEYRTFEASLNEILQTSRLEQYI